MISPEAKCDKKWLLTLWGWGGGALGVALFIDSFEFFFNSFRPSFVRLQASLATRN
jgi:hypothetical protein